MSQTSEMLSTYRQARRRLMGTPPKHSPTERQLATQLAEMTALYEDAIGVIAKQAREIEQLKKSQQPQPSPEQIEQYKSVTAGRLTLARIQCVVSSRFGISRIDIISDRRTMNVVRPRQIAMYLAKKLTVRSLPEIGRQFGDKDHTTVLNAFRKIANLIVMDDAWAAEVRACEAAVLDGLAIEAR